MDRGEVLRIMGMKDREVSSFVDVTEGVLVTTFEGAKTLIRPDRSTVAVRADSPTLNLAGRGSVQRHANVAEHPTVIDQLADAAAARRRELEQSRGATTGGPAEARVTLAARMRRFFGL